jgi:regulation of enolase protein 1 (concanavalin A-like superfamily)
MKYNFRLAMLPLILCMPLSAAQDNTPQQVEGWGQITDPDGDCRVTKDNGELTITIPNTHHDLTYTDAYTKLNSPRVLQPVEGDFTLQVTVRAFPLPGDAASSGGQFSFVSAGLLVWKDEKNFIRLERAAVAGSEAPFVWVERFRDGRSVSQQFKPLADKDTSLRVMRKGNRFTFLYDEDGQGKDWIEAHMEEVDLPTKIQVGVAAVNTMAREFSARLTGLELKPNE